MPTKPKISVVICTWNREKFIVKCLEHLTNQTLPKKDYEVIVINNNCTDDTEALVNNFISNNSSELSIRQVIEYNQGLSFARNRGIKEAEAKIITYIDDDGEAYNDYLENIIEFFRIHQKAVGVGGKVIPKYETSPPKWLCRHLSMMVTNIDYGEKMFKCYGKKYPAGCNMTYRKKILEEAGGFNNALKWRADDKYIFHAVRKVSDEIYYFPELKVEHNIDDERIEDKNFDFLSKKLGQEERLRVLSGSENFTLKKLEFLFKYMATFLMAIYYTLIGRPIVGKYLIRFRKLALIGLLEESR